MSTMSDLHLQIQGLLEQRYSFDEIAGMLDIPVSWVVEVSKG